MQSTNTTDDMKQFLPYIDVEQGLSRVLNNKKLYSRLLERFKDEKSVENTAKSLEQEDYDSALSHVHTLKGVVSNLSMEVLYQSTIALEASLKGSQINISGLMDNMQQAYDKTFAMLDEIIKVLE